MNATAALKEVADAYAAMQRGEAVHRTGGLPQACCRRLIRSVDVRALLA